jgi:hypothetical protein
VLASTKIQARKLVENVPKPIMYPVRSCMKSMRRFSVQPFAVKVELKRVRTSGPAGQGW